jgi:hypothetical protein
MLTFADTVQVVAVLLGMVQLRLGTDAVFFSRVTDGSGLDEPAPVTKVMVSEVQF